VQGKVHYLSLHHLSHPTYSPDVASCDFSRFGHIMMKLKGRSFAVPNALVCDVQEIFDKIWVTEGVKVFDE
jgi:hypothetical protein